MPIIGFQIETPFGPLTVSADDEAIVGTTWGRVSRTDSAPILHAAAEQLRAYFAGRLKHFDLPVRLSGSPFHLSVWRRMLEIPYGRTLTYGALAAAIGSSPRAVGGACGRNPIAVIVPCHRVMGVGNRLTGYSGGDGVATKAALLALEGYTVATQPALPL